MEDKKWEDDSHGFDQIKFKEYLDDFGPVVMFTCFFDNTNFLMTKYRIIDNNIHAILENERGETIQFSNLLCGYGGYGPSLTSELLKILGVPAIDADNLCHSERGFQIHLPYRKGDLPINIWFSDFNTHAPIFLERLNHKLFYSLRRRVIIFSNLEISLLPEMISCIKIMKPYSFSYSLDKREPLITHQELFISGLLTNITLQLQRDLGDINLIIKGELFDIYCGISHVVLAGTLNAIYFYLTGTTLFDEKQVNDFIYFQKKGKSGFAIWSVIKSLLPKKNKSPHNTLQLDIGQRRRQNIS